ncbi:hypothetical protein KJ934_00185 [Patescibacteria group bacterium]|nr:hypothetical protein [Patescibacteria group bacterium]MBU4353329.1 hypothetical protein [Patescibacteria group bacterium]MBU4476954.1 hypothetical protein [Patescibacteria group bacterium]MCG2699305.1 hypothetical protein [Candidatus Parcubacteria bacterium]
MKKIAAGLVLFLVMFFGFIGLTAPATANAMSAAGLEDVEIVQHHFTTRVIGVLGVVVTFDIKNPDLGRHIILTLRARASDEKINLCADEFTLIYSRKDGSEYKTDCKGICFKQNLESPGIFYLGNHPCTEATGPIIYFELLAYIEPDVTSIKILHNRSMCRLRVSARKLSARLYSNGGIDLSRVEDITINSGCDTFCSDDLATTHRGLAIRYAPHARKKAEEIASAMKETLGLKAEMKEMKDILSDYDIVIWVGQDCAIYSSDLLQPQEKPLVFY